MFAKRNMVSSLKLIDFGLCVKYNQDNNTLTEKCGTAIYMAPEVLNNCHYDKVSYITIVECGYMEYWHNFILYTNWASSTS